MTKSFVWSYRPIKENERNLVAGEFEVMIKMTQNRKRTYMATGFSTSMANWEFENDRPQSKHPQFIEVTNSIARLTEDIEYEIKTAQKANRIITPVEIKTKLTSIAKNATISVINKPNKIQLILSLSLKNTALRIIMVMQMSFTIVI